MSNESENQTKSRDNIPRKSIHFNDAIYYDGVHYFVKTLKHLTEAEVGYNSISAMCGNFYQFYGCTKNTYDPHNGLLGRPRFSENWFLRKHTVNKKEKDMILETHRLQS